MSPLCCSVRARAKINLSLHIAGRRADGYHELSGLVAFGDVADQLHLELYDRSSKFPAPGPEGAISEGQRTGWSLQVQGPFAPQLSKPCDPGDNLVLQAARLFSAAMGTTCHGSIELQKNLPIASGIGGGSSDAAAILSALQQACATPLSDDQLLQIALQLGADVPMCLTPSAQMVGGIGEIRQPVELFQPLPALLVNPGVSVATAQVFRQLQAGPVPDNNSKPKADRLTTQTPAALIEWLKHQGNDLQAPAMRIAPIIGEVLDVIARDDRCRLARMSGSGATCFGLYDCEQEAQQAAQEIAAKHPDWWVVATMLR